MQRTLIALVLAAPAGAQAAGASLFVDDATLLPAGDCQLESWARRYAPGVELTTAPACHAGGWELGVAVSEYFEPRRGPLATVGAKRLFRDFDAHSWGAAIAFGATWSADTDRLDAWNVVVPVSFALDAARTAVVHANVGWTDARDTDGAALAGLGGELALGDDWALLAEALGDANGVVVGQLGLRRSIGANATFDVLVGHQDDLAEGPWLTIGYNAAWDR